MHMQTTQQRLLARMTTRAVPSQGHLDHQTDHDHASWQLAMLLPCAANVPCMLTERSTVHVKGNHFIADKARHRSNANKHKR
eukprot:3295738-Amphidinium_carterae.2